MTDPRPVDPAGPVDPLEPSGGAAPVDPADLAAVAAQLGREPRGVRAVAHRCGCGRPDVVATSPRLPDGTPFPTLYYLTCPRATAAVSTLESQGVMREMQHRLAHDEQLREQYAAAHTAYLAARDAVEAVPQIAGFSGGGMPERVKCLHVLVAHALAAGPGVNPFGDEALALLDGGGTGHWGAPGSCVPVQSETP